MAAMRDALADDLNTAAALGAVFDMVRDANAAADRGEVKQDDTPHRLRALERFDDIFDVLRDDDAEKVRAVHAWAKAQGKEVKAEAPALTDAEVDALIAERAAARKGRDFKRSDEIRDQLAAAGIVVEDTKDGMRWKRK
jgi:cysteinyl-tRNA synthetase